MNIKRFVINIFFILGLFFISCSKKKDENLANNYYQLSLLELEDGSNNNNSYRRALCYIQKALEYHSKPIYESLKASLLLILGERSEAMSIYRSLLKKKIDLVTLADIKNNYSCVLAQDGKLDESLNILNGLIVDKNYLTPEVALLNKAKVLALKKDYQASKQALCEAIANDQNYMDAYFNLALISFYYLHDFDLAKETIKKAAFLDPENIRIKKLSDVIIKNA